MIERLAARINVRVWRHDLRAVVLNQSAIDLLDPAWVALLAARAWPIGAVQLHDAGHNLVVASGIDLLVLRMQGAFVGPLSHMAVGTGVITPAPGDVALGGEVFRDVFTQVTVATATMTIRNYLGPNDANGFTLAEAGLFNAASGPTLYARRLFDTPIVKTPDTAATLEWTLTFSADAALSVSTRPALRPSPLLPPIA